MPLHRHLRHSTSASAIPPRRLPSPSVLPATHSRPFVTNDIPSFNPTHRSTVAASAPRDILENDDKGILPPHDPSHTTPFSTFSHPSIPDTAPPSHAHIERPSIPPVHASSPSPASLSALPTPATSPRVDLRATTTPAYVSISRIGIMNEDIDGTTEQAEGEAEARRESTSIPIDLPSSISISPVGYAPPSPSLGAPRTMSRRFFTQLLEETRRRSRCTSQPSHPSSSPSTTTNLPPSPTLSTIVVSPPPRKSSLRPSVSAYPLGAHSNNTSTEDIDVCITETLYQLEQLAERVRLSSRSTSVLLASPTRTGFLKRSASVESLVDVCMRSPSPCLTASPPQTRGHRVNGIEVCVAPQIVVTLPSLEDVPSSSSDTSSESSSNTVGSGLDSGSGSEEEGSVPEDVRWISEYGRWSSGSGSSSGSASRSSTSSQECEDDTDNDNDSEESDVSSLFVDGDGGDDGEGEGDTDTLCTSPPTSPRGYDKGRRFMTEFELRSSSDTQAQGEGQGQAQGFTFSLRRPPSQLFRRPRVSVIRPSKSLVFQARTEMGQRPPPFKLPQARSSPHKDLPKLPLPSSLSYSYSSHPSPFTPPDLGSCHQQQQQHDLLRESVLPAQSQSCWSISTDGHGGPGKGGKGGWTKGLKRLFGRAR